MIFSRYDVQMCGDNASKVECRNLSYQLMVTARHGLTNLSTVKDEFDDVSRHEYVAARCTLGQELVGAYRIHHHHPISGFENLWWDKIGAYARPDHLADVSAFIVPGGYERFRIFSGLFIVMVEHLRSTNVDGVYIQSRTGHVRSYKRLGFRIVGDKFRVKGWSPEWRPMLLRIGQMLSYSGEPWFRKAWTEECGEQLSRGFWNIVRAHLVLNRDLPARQEKEVRLEESVRAPRSRLY